ncbi:hypothetical protein [Nocardioides sp. TF02-7]|uniref:carboxymuconolactone decarboxylase family protein n=1 Tax=Nocardioides sp. TF02-7 TaxID=2917724 RepID=UPI001F06E1BC|nr:hypothetical protein [Nocardioides sp. TF02-7]UMG93770.1 hypothetical protein MF408_06335 [Nocardioides sp. TF02-7]
METFLGPAPDSDGAAALFAEDRATWGFEMNLSRLWAHDPQSHDDLFALAAHAAAVGGLSVRQRALLVLATSGARRSSYCPLAWGTKFSRQLPPESAAGVITGEERPAGLDDGEVALVHWARQLATRPQEATAGDVDALRRAGFTDRAILGLTLYAALRVTFSTVNDALGAHPRRRDRRARARAGADGGRLRSPARLTPPRRVPRTHGDRVAAVSRDRAPARDGVRRWC